MNNKRIENLIPLAVKLISKNFVEKGNVKKVNQGYLASFGPTVITSGLLQAVSFYSADKDKNKVIKLMYELIKQELNTNAKNMFEFLTQHNNHKDYIAKNKIMDANIACKLAIRTFELKE